MWNFKYNRYVRGLFFLYKNYFGASRNQFGHIAKDVIINPPYNFSNKKNIFIYENTGIGSNSFISATNAKCIIKGNAAIAENFTVHTGNHANIVGIMVGDLTEVNKPKGYDHDVIIEKDVWIGCGVTILSGVHVGRGSIIAAGAVVNKKIPPYSVFGGIPAKFVKFKWTLDEILEHEQKVYSLNDRLTKSELEEIILTYSKLNCC